MTLWRQPGERGGSKVIGKAEVPLAAFFLSSIDASAGTPSAISIKIDVYLHDKVTGSLFVEGVFEPLEVEKGSELEAQHELMRSLCRSIGKSLSLKAKTARSSGAATISPDMEHPRCRPGRLEIHLVCVRHGEQQQLETGGMMAHIWLSSAMDDRKELKSKSDRSACSVDGVDASDVIWDRQTTLYAKDIGSDLLRVEILTMTYVRTGALAYGLLHQGHR